MAKSNRELAAERMSEETVLGALLRHQAAVPAPAAPAQAETAPSPAPPAAKPSRPALPTRQRVMSVVMTLTHPGFEALKVGLGFADRRHFLLDATQEARDALRTLGTPDGCYVDLELRALIAGAAGWDEPPFPAWAKPGAYCQQDGPDRLLGKPPRLILAIEGTVAILNGGERVPAGYLCRSWVPIPDEGGFARISDLADRTLPDVSGVDDAAVDAMLTEAAATIDAALKAKHGGGAPLP